MYDILWLLIGFSYVSAGICTMMIFTNSPYHSFTLYSILGGGLIIGTLGLIKQAKRDMYEVSIFTAVSGFIAAIFSGVGVFAGIETKPHPIAITIFVVTTFVFITSFVYIVLDHYSHAILNLRRSFNQSNDYEELLTLKGIYIGNLERFMKTAIKEITAEFVDLVSRYDNYWMRCIYKYEGFAYEFVWATPFDELHRAFGGDIGNQWYDGISGNTTFRISINPNNPAQFHISDKTFYPMNSGITFIGKSDGLSDKIITYEARKLGIPRYKFDHLGIGFTRIELLFEFPTIIKALIIRIYNTIKYERYYKKNK